MIEVSTLQDLLRQMLSKDWSVYTQPTSMSPDKRFNIACDISISYAEAEKDFVAAWYKAIADVFEQTGAFKNLRAEHAGYINQLEQEHEDEVDRRDLEIERLREDKKVLQVMLNKLLEDKNEPAPLD